jgi:hypothetical protein
METILSWSLWILIPGCLVFIFTYAFIGMSVAIAHYWLDVNTSKKYALPWRVRVARYFFFPSLIFQGVDEIPWLRATTVSSSENEAERESVSQNLSDIDIFIVLLWPLFSATSVVTSLIALAIYCVVKFISIAIYSIYAGILMSRTNGKDKLKEKIHFAKLDSDATRGELIARIKEVDSHRTELEAHLKTLDHKDEAAKNDRLPHRNSADAIDLC